MDVIVTLYILCFSLMSLTPNVCFTQSTSQFGPATFQATSCHLWLMDTTWAAQVWHHTPHSGIILKLGYT